MISVVIGAGPAGLLYAFINRITLLNNHISHDEWPIFLVDKRTSYSRNHRLILDSNEFVKIQKKLDHPQFDAFVSFLEPSRFKPVVNELEVFLKQATINLGVEFLIDDIGNRPNQTTVDQLYAQLSNKLKKPIKHPTCLVIADSVNSKLREELGFNTRLKKGTHEHLVRIKIEGPNLPDSINPIENYKLAKVLGSVLSYRSNRNGFAELDVFLSPKEFEQIKLKQPNPKNPLIVDEQLFEKLDTPFLAQISLHFLKKPGTRLSITSSFTLEHSISPERVKPLPHLDSIGYLLGDAAIALPFQRGMTAIVKSAYCLANVHLTIFQKTISNQSISNDDLGKIGMEYQRDTEKIIENEIQIVASRASLVGGLREFIRISSILPFPIQSWLLSYPTSETKMKFDSFFLINLVIALTGLLFFFLSEITITSLSNYLISGTELAIAFILQFLGGVFYRASITFNAQSNSSIRKVWQYQILLWMILGFGFVFQNFTDSTIILKVGYTLSWWFGGITFLLGLLLFDWLGKFWWLKSELDPS